MPDIKIDKYGAVYTLPALAKFAATLTKISTHHKKQRTVLDPACGELALFKALEESKTKGTYFQYIGVDIDHEALEKVNREQNKINNNITLFNEDFIMPRDKSKNPEKYWTERIGKVDLVLSNPPWSTERRHTTNELKNSGYRTAVGQYDAYVLFVEQSLKALKKDGLAVFILPDSLFSKTNIELRKYLCEEYTIKTIARLGEKFFPGVNRSTSVLVVQNTKPKSESKCRCFRLNTESRREVLSGGRDIYDFFKEESHLVHQARFAKTESYTFDIDTRLAEEKTLDRIENSNIRVRDVFKFHRGVEISKKGMVTECGHCGNFQGYTAEQQKVGIKRCTFCRSSFTLKNTKKILKSTKSEGDVSILVGQDVQRYNTKAGHFLTPGIKGISYKNEKIYHSPKVLVRKTGLGINAAIDESDRYVTQTVYILKTSEEANVSQKLWYYLALLNSRVVFFYYLKVSGENEWKSHPYFTKALLFQLPLAQYEKVGQAIVGRIAQLAKELQNSYDKAVDLELERLIFKAYGLSQEEINVIEEEMDRLPNLSAINGLKF